MFSWIFSVKFLICFNYRIGRVRVNGSCLLLKRFEKFGPSFSISLFVIRVQKSSPSLTIRYGLLSFLWCLSIFVKYHFQVSINLTVILSMLKITPWSECAPLTFPSSYLCHSHTFWDIRRRRTPHDKRENLPPAYPMFSAKLFFLIWVNFRTRLEKKCQYFIAWNCKVWLQEY